MVHQDMEETQEKRKVSGAFLPVTWDPNNANQVSHYRTITEVPLAIS